MEARTPLLQAIEVVSKALQTPSDEPVVVKEPEQVTLHLTSRNEERPWEKFRKSRVIESHVPILRQLKHGDRRRTTSELAALANLDNRLVSNSLVMLKGHGLLDWHKAPGKRATYSITDKGRRWLAAWDAI